MHARKSDIVDARSYSRVLADTGLKTIAHTLLISPIHELITCCSDCVRVSSGSHPGSKKSSYCAIFILISMNG